MRGRVEQEKELMEHITHEISPEYRGEAWIVLQKCLKTFDPNVGELLRMFRCAWRHRRIDMKRREAKHSLLCVSEGVLNDCRRQTRGNNSQENAMEFEELLPALKECEGWGMFHSATLRGYRQTAVMFGVPLGTVKSNVHRIRGNLSRAVRRVA